MRVAKEARARATKLTALFLHQSLKMIAMQVHRRYRLSPKNKVRDKVTGALVRLIRKLTVYMGEVGTAVMAATNVGSE